MAWLNLFVVFYGMFLLCWMWLHIDAFAFRLFSKDTKWKTIPPPSESQIKSAGEEDKINLVFIRHGESTWNQTFNRSKIPVFFIPRLIECALLELQLIFTGKQDSWFIDSPLNTEGMDQANKVREYLAKNRDDAVHGETIKMMLGESDEPSVMVTSNLRRAISTGVISVWDRLRSSGEKILVHSALQEISKNPDTLAISPPGSVPVPSWIDCKYEPVDMSKGYKSYLDAEFNTGSKALASTGQQRMQAFNEWAFSEASKENFICFGHSLWFRSFFREYLADSSKHVSKNKKMKNCAVVKLTLRRIMTNGQAMYSIDESSISSVYLGFEK